MIEKLNSVIHKLKQTVMEPGVMYLYFNVYLLKRLFFSCGIVNLSIKQEEKIQKKYKTVIVQKHKTRNDIFKGSSLLKKECDRYWFNKT